jgi:signal transduction histidine kinase
MQRGLISLLWRLGLAFGTIATATVLTIVLWRLHAEALPRIAPFLFLCAVLASSWVGGYTAGFASVLFANGVSSLLMRRDLAQVDPYRLALLLLLSGAVSWIEHHRRHVESQLRTGVELKTAELRAAVENLEREVQERKAAEEEIRRLNHLLELRVDERTRQLEISNQELESFSYSVSHDLRAPLRSIDGFSRILLGTCPAKLDEEERGLFQRILAATGRMNELIDDLLNLARVTRSVMHSAPVDLSALATRIAGELRDGHPESGTRFVIEPGLTATGDNGLIEVVLHNLLENAWKFSSHSPSPCVEFGAMSISGERVLFVRDNGAGFDPAYKNKLFSPFQRLHRQEEFPGTGIGLATVSRIVHRHGGWITGEAQPDKGATFFFTLASSAVKSGGTPVLYRPDEPEPPAPQLEAPSSSPTESALT